MRNRSAARTCVDYIMHFIGLPYRWGGDDPIGGFDCSGLAVEMLKAGGFLNDSADFNADGLYRLYRNFETSRPGAGVLVFYGDVSATHVGICIDEELMIEAGGGGSKTQTEEDAILQNAYIRIRPIRRRSDILGFLDPFRK